MVAGQDIFSTALTKLPDNMIWRLAEYIDGGNKFERAFGTDGKQTGCILRVVTRTFHDKYGIDYESVRKYTQPSDLYHFNDEYYDKQILYSLILGEAERRGFNPITEQIGQVVQLLE